MSEAVRRKLSAQPRMSQAERSARTERRLLNAALKLVSEQGFDRTSLAQIGSEAGYSRGVVNHFYGTKSGLLAALVDWLTEQWERDGLTPAETGLVGVEALCSVVDAVHAETVRSPVQMRAFFLLLFEALGPSSDVQPRFADLHRALRQRARDLIEAGITAGDVREDVDADAQAALFVGAFRGLGYQWLIDPEAIDLDRHFEELKRTLRAALSAGT